VSYAEKFPQLAERCKSLNIEVKAEFGILEVELITGLGHSWIRKAITGYRGKGLRAAPQMHARKVSLDGGDISAWRVPIQDVAEKLAEVIEGRQHEADRFSNPAKYVADERRPSTAKAINTIARIAEEAGLSEEERALLAKLSARIKEVANS
jgi:hypothetical protein